MNQYFVAHKEWCEYHERFEWVYWSDKEQEYRHKIFGTIFDSLHTAQQTANAMAMSAKHGINVDKFYVLDIYENIIYETDSEKMRFL